MERLIKPYSSIKRVESALQEIESRFIPKIESYIALHGYSVKKDSSIYKDLYKKDLKQLYQILKVKSFNRHGIPIKNHKDYTMNYIFYYHEFLGLMLKVNTVYKHKNKPYLQYFERHFYLERKDND